MPSLVEQPKWYKTERDLNVGDIVLFSKEEKEIRTNYQFGIVVDVEVGRDGVVRKAKVKYKNSNESTYRETFRAVRSLIVIHHTDEINVMQEMGKIALQMDLKAKREKYDNSS